MSSVRVSFPRRIVNQSSMIIDWVRLRKKGYLAIILPAILLTVVFQSVIIIVDTVENSMRPPINEISTESDQMVDFVVSSSVSLSMWDFQFLDNPLTILSAIINDSILDVGLQISDFHLYRLAAKVDHLSATMENSQNVFSVSVITVDQGFLSDIRYELALKGQNASLTRNETWVVLSPNFPISYQNITKFNFFNISIILNVSYMIDDDFFRIYFRRESDFLGLKSSGTELILIITPETMNLILNQLLLSRKNAEEMVALDLFAVLTWNAQARSRYVYGTQSETAKIVEFMDALKRSGSQRGITVEVSMPYNVLGIAESFSQYVISMRVVWLILSLPVLILAIVVFFTGIQRMQHEFTSQSYLLTLRGLELNWFRILYFIELLFLILLSVVPSIWLTVIGINQLFLILQPNSSVINNSNSFLLSNPFSNFIVLLIVIGALYVLSILLNWRYLLGMIRNPLSGTESLVRMKTSSIPRVIASSRKKTFARGTIGFIGIAALFIVIYFPIQSSSTDVVILKILLLGFGILIMGLGMPSMYVHIFVRLQHLLRKLAVLRNSSLPSIHWRLLPVHFKRSIIPLRMFFFISFLIIIVLGASISYQHAFRVTALYNNGGAAMTIHLGTSENDTLLTTLQQDPLVSAVTVVARNERSNLGTSGSPIVYSFNLLVINPNDYGNVVQVLDKDLLSLSESSTQLLSAMQENNHSIIVHKSFLSEYRVSIGDVFTIFIQNPSGDGYYKISLIISGTFNLWPGLVSLSNELDSEYHNIPVIVSFGLISELMNLTNMTLNEQLTYQYLIKPRDESSLTQLVTKYSFLAPSARIFTSENPEFFQIIQSLIFIPSGILFLISIALFALKAIFEIDILYESARQEYAVMRCFGFTRGQLRRQIFYLYLSLLSMLLLGITLGYWLGGTILAALELPIMLPVKLVLDINLLLPIVLLLMLITAILPFGLYLRLRGDSIADVLTIED